ncbi:MAG: tRNA (adenosine(37)-N6)-threonylcarbamoyltransferase complex dimerization subunit type 1 TsaB [Cyclobacteriaceae bacterium]
MAIILSIETATTMCSVALHKGPDLLAIRELDEDKSHSRVLAGMIQDVIVEGGLEMSELDAVAISQGPGSYTGLRIGTATAKGLCFSLDIPLIAVSTLKSMAHGMKFLLQADKMEAWLCPMIDARRMEVYCWLADANLNEIEAEQAKVIVKESFDVELEHHQIVFFGNGAAKCEPLLGQSNNALFNAALIPSASFVGNLAQIQYAKKKFQDLAYFEPEYLKEFQTTKPKARID